MDDLNEELARLFGTGIADQWASRQQKWDGYAIIERSGKRKKKHCPNGHLLDRPLVEVRWQSGSYLRCRVCKSLDAKKRYQRRKEAGAVKRAPYVPVLKPCLNCGGPKEQKKGARWCGRCLEGAARLRARRSVQLKE